MDRASESRYTYCPDCGRKKVIFVTRGRGEDGYYCTAPCDFDFFSHSDMAIDHVQEVRWEAANGLPPSRTPEGITGIVGYLARLDIKHRAVDDIADRRDGTRRPIARERANP